MRKYKWMTALVLVCCFVMSVIAEQEAEETVEAAKRIGDINSGNMAGEVHVIKIYDDEGFIIHPEAESPKPMSIARSCVACHSYGVITGMQADKSTLDGGWHFNQKGETLNEEGEIVQGDPGRKGEPWIYWDASAGVQMPLSYRGWKGTIRPEDIGISDWEFTKIFGRHMPGGGISVRSDRTYTHAGDNWENSGNMEVNCFSCHEADAKHSQMSVSEQTSMGNFGWAGTASCAFATVEGGSVQYNSVFSSPDGSGENMPEVTYDKGKFKPGNEVFVNIGQEIDEKRCYFCHSNKNLGGSMDDDVHMKAGLTCIDCHTNGLDHRITRGYEGEEGAEGVTCAGCHIGDEHGCEPTAGRLGAPFAKHVGIPAVHFDKLSCTSCHSGPWPGSENGYVKTSRAHGLGLHTANQSDKTLPHVQWPVFVEGEDGKITPSKLIWPAYWGVLKDEKVSPISPAKVKEAAEGILLFDAELPETGEWVKFTDEKVLEVLAAVSNKLDVDGEAVYVAGGKVNRAVDGKLVGEKHEAGEPYTWPIAHNVRGAKQALGVRKCKDCHTTDSAMTFGTVAVDSPLVSDDGLTIQMSELQDVDATHLKLFAMSFVFRPMMKIIGFGVTALICAVLGLYLLKALDCVIGTLAGKKK